MKTDDKLQQDVIVSEKKNVSKSSGTSAALIDFTLAGSESPKRNAWDTLRHRWQRLSGARNQ